MTVALRPSLKFLIAVSLRVFTVMNLGGVVVWCENTGLCDATSAASAVE